MARVAVAYVEVRPDLGGFGEQVRAALKGHRITEKVKIDVDSRDLNRQISKAVSSASPSIQDFAKQLKAAYKGGEAERTESLVRPLKDMEKVAFNVHQNLAKWRRQDAQSTYAVVGSVAKFRQAMDKETADHADRVNREAAENYVRYYQRALERRMMLGDLELSNLQRMTDQMRTDFETRFGDKLGNVFAPLDRQLDRAMMRAERKLILRPKLDTTTAARSASRFVRRMTGIFGSRSILGRTVSAFGSLMASAMETAGVAAAKAVEFLAGAAADLGKGMSKSASTAAAGAIQMGVTSATAAADIAAMATSVGGLVAILAALAAACALAVVAVSALELVIGAVLAVVIPLVGGITALVAELSALAAVGIGSIALLPGVLLAATAAFGPLVLVADKFQKLFENTAKHTGELYGALEHLKNAIFAVMTTGFVEGIERFSTTVLPKLFNGITLVAEAWNKLFMSLIDLASMPETIEAANAALQVGARIVDLFAQAIKDVGPGLLAMAVTALPHVESLLQVVSQMVREFGAWLTEMNKSGQLTALFDQLTPILRETLGLVRPLAELMGSWIVAILPAARQFVGLLSGMVNRWRDLAGSAEGQEKIQTFFEAMNRIVVAFEPILEKIVDTFLDFGPTLADLVESSVPALEAVIDTVKTFLETVAPWLEQFMRVFADQLADPAVQKAIGELGAAVGLLLIQFTSFGTEGLEVVIYGLVGLAVGLSIVIGFFSSLNDAVYKVVDAFIKLSKFLPAVAIASIGAKLLGASNQAKNTGAAMNTMATTTQSAATKSSAAINAFSIHKSWNALKANILAIDDYMRNMANNGIEGNEKLINSMAAMAAAAYESKNDADQARFEKMVGRAYKMPTGTLGRVTKSARDAGTAAGNAFNAGLNSTIATSAGATTKKKGKVVKKNAAGVIADLKPALASLDIGALINSRLAGSKAYDTGWEIAGYMAKGLTSGAKNIAKVQRFIYNKMSKDFKGISTAIEKFVKDVNNNIGGLTAAEIKALKGAKTASQMQDVLNNVKQRQNELLNQIVQWKDQVVEALAPRRNLVNIFGYIATPEEIKAELDAQLATVTRFTTGLDALAAAGLSPELRRAWLEAGVDTAGNMVEALRNATPEQIKAINDSYAALDTKAKTTAEQQSTVWFGVGEETVRGYIKGIESMQSTLNAAMIKAMKDANAEAKKYLKAKSPSQRYADLGVDTLSGYIKGVDAKAGDTVDAIGKVFERVAGVKTAPLAVPSMAIPRPGYASMSIIPPVAAPQVNVRVFIGDQELTDIVDTEIEIYDSDRARTLLSGRRGG